MRSELNRSNTYVDVEAKLLHTELFGTADRMLGNDTEGEGRGRCEENWVLAEMAAWAIHRLSGEELKAVYRP